MENETHEVNLLKLFPEEVWLIILKEIKAATDYMNICQSSPFLENLMKQFSTQVLFSKVAEILHSQLYSKPVLSRLMLNCRSVCRSWKTAVDDFFQKLEHHIKLLDTVPNDNAFTSILCSSEIFRNKRDLAIFNEHFAKTHTIISTANPFIFRHVRIVYGSDDETEPFLKDLLPFLQEYGAHIWYCTICITDIFSDRVNCYIKLKRILEMIPNLKAVDIRCISMISEEELEALESELHVNGMPTLENLVCLREIGLPTPFLNALLLRNSSICTLSGDRQATQVGSLLYQQSLPKLEQLGVSYYNATDFMQLEIFNVSWPLKKLILSTSMLEMEWKCIFRVVERHFASTLKELVLRFPEINQPEIVSAQAIGSLSLPHLEALTLEMRKYTPLDFILPMKQSLTRLNLRVNCTSTSQKKLNLIIQNEGAIKFFAHREAILESNIWQLFPKLQSVCYFDWQISSRWNQYTRKQLKDCQVDHL